VLSLESSTANAGFVKRVNSTGPSRVEVEFESDDLKVRIRARMSGGGIIFDVNEESDGGGGGGDDDGSDDTIAPLDSLPPVPPVPPIPEISVGEEPEDVIIDIEIEFEIDFG
jgi:hypothetical protein